MGMTRAIAWCTIGLLGALDIGLGVTAHHKLQGRRVAQAPSASPAAMSTCTRAISAGARAPSDAFTYTGRWQRVRGQQDGRPDGISSRSFHQHDAASIAFTGTRVCLLGVRGPTGGTASVAIDGKPMGYADFYAARKNPCVTVYTSPHLSRGKHHVTVRVAATVPTLPKQRYVNLAGARYTT